MNDPKSEVKLQMYKYETHLHTYPVSKCASAGVRESLEYYKKLGYDGVFITNHFLDGHINFDTTLPYQEQIDFYFSDYEEGIEIGKELGIKVFCGVEMSYMGIDFLIYGLDKAWYLANPQIMKMKKKEELTYLMSCGALVIHAHPFREDAHNDYIRLFPRQVHGVEIINSSRTDDVNEMARLYAKHYGLLEFAGSDNHCGAKVKRLAGMYSDSPIHSEQEFVDMILHGKMKLFCHEV